MKKVISNASPIIGLSMIGKLNLLWELFDVYIARTVYDEITGSNQEGFGHKELKDAIEKGNIKIYEVKDKDIVNKLYGHLHKGEIETIIAAKELDITYVIIDEKSARSFAKSLLLKPLGVLGVLQRAKELDKINSIIPHLDILIKNGFRISDKLYKKLVEESGEELLMNIAKKEK